MHASLSQINLRLLSGGREKLLKHLARKLQGEKTHSYGFNYQNPKRPFDQTRLRILRRRVKGKGGGRKHSVPSLLSFTLSEAAKKPPLRGALARQAVLRHSCRRTFYCALPSNSIPLYTASALSLCLLSLPTLNLIYKSEQTFRAFSNVIIIQFWNCFEYNLEVRLAWRTEE